MSMFISTAQARTKSAPRILLIWGRGIFAVNSRVKVPLRDVHLDCTGSHKLGAAALALRRVSFYYRAVLVFWAMSKSCGRCGASAGHRTFFHLRGRRGTLCTSLNRLQAWVKMRGAFGAHFSWLEQYLVNVDDVFERVESPALRNFILIHFGHGDDFTWQVHCRCPGSFFVAGAVLCRPRQESAWNVGKTSLFEIFNGPFSSCAQCLVKI